MRAVSRNVRRAGDGSLRGRGGGREEDDGDEEAHAPVNGLVGGLVAWRAGGGAWSRAMLAGEASQPAPPLPGGCGLGALSAGTGGTAAFCGSGLTRRGRDAAFGPLRPLTPTAAEEGAGEARDVALAVPRGGAVLAFPTPGAIVDVVAEQPGGALGPREHIPSPRSFFPVGVTAAAGPDAAFLAWQDAHGGIGPIRFAARRSGAPVGAPRTLDRAATGTPALAAAGRHLAVAGVSGTRLRLAAD